MLVFDLVRLMDLDITPDNTKVHLAAWNGSEDPLQVYFQGEFDDWQTWQTQRNFDLPYVLSLIKMPEEDRWLYVGIYASSGYESLEDGQHFRYRLKAQPACSELAGRLLVKFTRPGRQSYLDANEYEQDMVVHELRPERIHMAEFPGFKKVDLPFRDLNILVRQNSSSWRVALSNVAGVYLVSDPQAGKLYVGSAHGEGGIWAQWSRFIQGGGDDVELMNVIAELGAERARLFRFSILEIADMHASPEEVLAREMHWKGVLLFHGHGYSTGG